MKTQKPQSTSVHDAFTRAAELEQQGLFIEAENIYIKISATNKKKKASALFRLGKLNEKQKKFDAAQKNYQELISTFPPRPAWFLRLAECKRKQKLNNDAIKYYRAAMRLDPTNPHLLLRLSQTLLIINDSSLALLYAEELVEHHKRPEYFAHKAHVLSRLKHWHASVDTYQKAINLDPDKANPLWLVRQGECYSKLNSPEQAISCYHKALEKEPGNANFQAALAMAYTKTNQNSLAIEFYQQAIWVDKNNADWFIELGRLLADVDKKSALIAYQRAVALGRKSVSYEMAALSDDNKNVKYIKPEILLSGNRFDLCVKSLYARKLLGFSSCHSLVNPTELYLRHVHLRTRGNEPNDLKKNSLQDYQDTFIQLITSIKINGFDKNSAIPLAKNGVILNGAHRTAAALALNVPEIPVLLTDQQQGINWDFSWFIKRGFSIDELNELLLYWLEHNTDKAHIIVLWPAVISYWDEITAHISSEIQTITQRDLKLSKIGLTELIKDIYSMDKVADFMPSIMEKVKLLSKYEPSIRLLVVNGDREKVNHLKSFLRKQYNKFVPEQLFCTLHASDNHDETMHLGRIFLHDASLTLLRKRKKVLPPHLCRWLAETKKELLKRGASVLGGCAVGGAVLDAYEIRQADDFDITVSSSIREVHFNTKASSLTNDIDIVNKDYAKSVAGTIDDDTLLTDRSLHIYIRGFKFANIDVVRQRKSYSQREKDLVDLEKIGHYIYSLHYK